MRDPDLVQRAERAAFALERAWDRWRTKHGFGSDPLPPVSSYVGYSLEEPWGQPRVVFGVDAEEAELLAALLDGHECVGPVHAELTASSEWRRATANGMGTAPWPSADQLSIPAQAPQPGSEMLPTARQADVDGGPAETGTSTLPGPDVLEPGSVDGAAASPATPADGTPADGTAGGAAATDGVSAGRGQSASGKAGSRSSGSGPSASGRSGNGASGSGPSASGKSGHAPSGSPSSVGLSSVGPSSAGGLSAEGPSGSGPSGSGPSAEGPSGSGPARGDGGSDPAATTEANDTNGPPQSAASRPKPRKPPAASPARTEAVGHSGAADAPAIGPERGPQAAQAGQGQPPAPPQPGIVAFRPRSESQQAEPPAPTTSSDDLLPNQAPGHRGPRYQGYPPQYQDGPDPRRAPKTYAAAPVADSEARTPASQPERGKSRQVSRLGRTRRQGPGAHESWGSAGDQTATDHAV